MYPNERVMHVNPRVSREPGTVLEVRKLVLVKWDGMWHHEGWYRQKSLVRVPSGREA